MAYRIFEDVVIDVDDLRIKWTVRKLTPKPFLQRIF